MQTSLPIEPVWRESVMSLQAQPKGQRMIAGAPFPGIIIGGPFFDCGLYCVTARPLQLKSGVSG